VRADELESLKTELQRRRRTLLETARRAQVELEGLRSADRDPEFEEGAQIEHEEYTLHRLTEVQRTQIRAIDAALARMEDGEYGVCLDCGQDIDPRRLKALPFTLLCADDALRRERGTGAGVSMPTL
jgi:DnaK suppressor protein